jgi:hypothetical protein
MTEISRGRGRPRIYTDAEIELAFKFPCAVAAAHLGKSVRAIEKLRARVRARQSEDAWA